MMWESIAEENCAMDCSSFQISPRNTASKKGVRRALHCNDMAIDELSFYEDETTQQQQQTGSSTELMGLLSPEGSPQRFHIVPLQTQNAGDNFLQPLALTSCQQKLQTPNMRSNNHHTSSNTPARSLRVFNSLSSTSSMESSMDDEYMELFAIESLESQQQNMSDSGFNLPSNLNSLISGQIKNASPVAAVNTLKTPEMRRPSVRRCLSMTENTQPKTPELLLQEAACFKRPEPPTANSSPMQIKRHRLADKENHNSSANISVSPPAATTTTTTHAPPLRKCMSMNDAEIMSALSRCDNKDEAELIGDFSKTYALPLMEGRHRDLKSISSNTVARLLRGDFKNEVASYKIIDCRYPYEFEGGHIPGAKNLYTQEQIMEEFLTGQKTEQQEKENAATGNKRNIIIFHCEFSSERGPKMSRFLRDIDRKNNQNSYPALNYPEVYLLHNGYKDFFETHSELCQPEAYRPMLEPSFNEAYRHFRAKSKSWNGDGLGGAATGRLKKSRSRLLL